MRTITTSIGVFNGFKCLEINCTNKGDNWGFICRNLQDAGIKRAGITLPESSTVMGLISPSHYMGFIIKFIKLKKNL